MDEKLDFDIFRKLAKNIKDFWGFPIKILENTAQGMSTKLSRIIGDTIDDGETDLKPVAKKTTMDESEILVNSEILVTTDHNTI